MWGAFGLAGSGSSNRGGLCLSTLLGGHVTRWSAASWLRDWLSGGWRCPSPTTQKGDSPSRWNKFKVNASHCFFFLFDMSWLWISQLEWMNNQFLPQTAEPHRHFHTVQSRAVCAFGSPTIISKDERGLWECSADICWLPSSRLMASVQRRLSARAAIPTTQFHREPGVLMCQTAPGWARGHALMKPQGPDNQTSYRTLSGVNRWKTSLPGRMKNRKTQQESTFTSTAVHKRLFVAVFSKEVIHIRMQGSLYLN